MGESTKNLEIVAESTRGLSARSLAKAIFKAEVPEQFIRSLPAQTLYMVIKENGLVGSGDLIAIASVAQVRLLLDLDFWSRDQFSEENFWEWLSLTDDEDGLKILQKILKSADLKLIALMISRYVEVTVFDQPNEAAPAARSYTPDQGFTWITIKIEDDTRHLLMGRLLAMIFETSAELFYQLTSIPRTTTDSVLEEDGYQDRTRRLNAEGIPDLEHSAQINALITEQAIKADLKGGVEKVKFTDIPVIEPLVYHTGVLQPLQSLYDLAGSREEFASELTLIMNAGMVHWGVAYHEHESVSGFIAKVRGALNIGLQSCIALGYDDLLKIYETLGLQKIYRYGLLKLLTLRNQARKLKQTDSAGSSLDSTTLALIDAASLPFPEIPSFLKDLKLAEGENDALRLKGGNDAIETLGEVERISIELSKLSKA